MKQKFYFFRHGETEWNRLERIQGHTDIPLNEVGEVQAQTLAQFFKRAPHRPILLVSSDLERAVKTAALALAHNAQTELHLDPNLRETNFGQLEGWPREKLFSNYGKDFFKEFISNRRDFADGDLRLTIEPSHHVLTRAWGTVWKYLRKAASKKQTLVISTHGGILRHLYKKIHNGAEFPMFIPNAALFSIEADFSDESMRWENAIDL